MSGQWPVVRGGCFSGHWSLVTAICIFSPMEVTGYGTEGGVPAGWDGTNWAQYSGCTLGPLITSISNG